MFKFTCAAEDLCPPNQLLSAYFMDSAFSRQPWFLCFFGFQGCCSSQQHPDPSLASQSPRGPLECGPSLLSDLRTYDFPSCCYSLSTRLAFLKHSKLIPASGLFEHWMFPLPSMFFPPPFSNDALLPFRLALAQRPFLTAHLVPSGLPTPT